MSEAVQVIRLRTGEEGLARAAVEEVEGRKVDVGALGEFLGNGDCYLLVAIVGEGVVGCLVGHALRKPHRAGRQMLLYSVDVKEGWRGIGAGTALVRGFVDEGRSVGAHGVWVVTNEGNRAAVRVYERCGFRRVNRDDVMMEMSLGDG